MEKKPLVPAGTQAPPAYAQDKLPYRLKWGANTVVVEVEHGMVSDDDPHQPHQVRIVNASGHLLRQIDEVDRVEVVQLVKPMVTGEQGLLIGITGGNSGLVDYYGFGTGVTSRFHVEDAIHLDVKDLNGDGTAEIIAVYRISDIDGGGEHHGPQVTVVYQWNGTKYVEATRNFPSLTRVQEKEYQASLIAIESKASQSNAAPDPSEQEIDGHLDAATGYLTNAIIAGDSAQARAWLKDNVNADRLHVPSGVNKSLAASIQDMLKPLDQDFGDGSLASVPASTTAQKPQPAKAKLVPGQSLGFVRMGEARVDVISAIKIKPTASYDLKHGLVEDEWSGKRTDGTDEYYSDLIWSRKGKVVQAEATINELQKRNIPSFNALVARARSLKEVCYLMADYVPAGDSGGGEYNLFCFDDVKRGIAYAIGVNGDAYMTDKPDIIIIHIAGVPYIPLRGVTNVTRVTGPMSILYQNQTEEDKADALETKMKSSHADAHKRH